MFPWQNHPTEEQIAVARAARQRHLAEHEAAIQRLIAQSHGSDQWRAEQARKGDDYFAEVIPPGWLGELDGLDEVRPGVYQSRIDPDNRWLISGP